MVFDINALIGQKLRSNSTSMYGFRHQCTDFDFTDKFSTYMQRGKAKHRKPNVELKKLGSFYEKKDE